MGAPSHVEGNLGAVTGGSDGEAQAIGARTLATCARVRTAGQPRGISSATVTTPTAHQRQITVHAGAI